MREVLKKIGNWVKVNRMALIYPVLAIVIEMTAVFAVEGTPFLTHPLLSLGLLAVLTGLLLILPDNRARLAVGGVLLVVHLALDVIFAVIFEMTTGQYFDFGMLNLRNDAVAILESIPINFFIFYAGVLACILYVVFGIRSFHTEKGYKVKKGKYSLWYYLALIAVGLCTTTGAFLVYYPAETDRYEDMVYGEISNVYAAYGMIGNVIGEVGNLFKKDTPDLKEENVQEFLYKEESEKTEYFGVAKDKNVIMILGESFEWFAFMNSEEYPNALFTDEELKKLYPNLWKFYNESVVATNYHSREKTDISETLSILGSYPVDAYVNYEYYENTIPHTVPNTLKILDPNVQTRSFHNGYKTFYNRMEAHKTFGFEELEDFEGGMTDMYDMEKIAIGKWEEKWESKYKEDYGVNNTNGNKELKYSKAIVDQIVKDYIDDWKLEQGAGWSKEEAAKLEADKREELKLIFTNYERNGELNLDSEMIEICKDLMFPKEADKEIEGYDGKRFYTYITTISMHGVYYDRENLKNAYSEMEKALGENGASRLAEVKAGTVGIETADALYNYMITAKEFDMALGGMMEDLEEKNLLDDTIIMLYGDHNAYYQQVSNYVKDIYKQQEEGKKFTNLYKVPLMIHDTDLQTQLIEKGYENGHMEVDKFACTSDLVPTLFDLLGIKYYSNMYYGNSLFSDTESVLYSRAYGYFVREGLVAKTVKNVQYNYWSYGVEPTADNYKSKAEYDEMMSAFDADAQSLVEKIKYCDYVFEEDYFGKPLNYMWYYINLRKLNGLNGFPTV